MFGERVELKYVDLADPEAREYPQVEEVTRNRRVRLPLMAVNGQIKWSGSVSWAFMMNELAARGFQGV